MKILLNGLENTTHSVALVHQFQLMAMAKIQGNNIIKKQKIIHDWPQISPGFNASDLNIIESVQSPFKGEEFDAEYSIGGGLIPNKFKSNKRYMFYVTEFGKLTDAGKFLHESIEQGIELIVPSQWVKNRIQDNIGTCAPIHVIPHGYSEEYFYPQPKNVRMENRKLLGIPNDSYVFLNIGALTWNKGVDALLIAFSNIHSLHPNAKLILKDSSNLYSLTAESLIRNLLEKKTISESCINSIYIIQGHIDLQKLNLIYGLSDCYVSPYRAEGFNLPVIEAMATNCSVIVTDGGPTDDYINDEFSIKIESIKLTDEIGTYLQPSIESLIDSMLRKISDGPRNDDEQRALCDKSYEYKNIAKSILHLFSINC